MIIMPVPKDIRKMEPKFIGPLTKRQTIFLAPAALIAYIVFFTLAPIISQDVAMPLIIILDLPLVACGFLNPYGMPFYIYVKDIVTNKVLAPSYRPYATENVFKKYGKQNMITYEFFDGDTEEYTEKEMKKKKKENKKRFEKFLKENPELKPIE